MHPSSAQMDFYFLNPGTKRYGTVHVLLEPQSPAQVFRAHFPFPHTPNIGLGMGVVLIDNWES